MRTSSRRSTTPPDLDISRSNDIQVWPKTRYNSSGVPGHDFGAQYYARMHPCQRLPRGVTTKGS
ncbi:hypothetical protein ACFL4L_07425 [bacterium]